MAETQYIEYECTSMSFQPLQRHPVRWLEWEQDEPLVQDFWPEQTPAGWQEAREEGFQYCAVVEPRQLQAWRRSGAIRRMRGKLPACTRGRKHAGVGMPKLSFRLSRPQS